MIYILKNLVIEVDNMQYQMSNFIRELKIIRKSSIEMLKI